MVLATCAKDLKFYNWPEISLLGVYETSDDSSPIKTLSWDKEGKYVVLVRGNGHAVIVQAPVRIEESIQPHINIKYMGTTAATFSNVSNHIVALGTCNGEVKVYDARLKDIIAEYKKIPAVVQNVEFLKQDLCLAVGCNNGQIVLFNKRKEPCTTFVVPFSASLTTVVSHKIQQNLLAAASKEGIISVWDVDKASNKLTAKHHTGVVTDVAFSGDTVTSVSVDHNLIIYDLRDSRQAASYNLNSPLSGLSYLNNTYELAVSTCDGQLRSYDSRFMTSPLHTVVAYSSWIKKIAFPHAINPPTSGGKCRSLDTRKNISVEEASGDFAVETRGALMKDTFSEMNSTIDLIRSISEVLCINGDEKVSVEDLTELIKDVDRQIKLKKSEFEEKMLQRFYLLRIDGSKQFISLEEHVNESWENFIEYLKHTGSSKKAKSRAASSKRC